MKKLISLALAGAAAVSLAACGSQGVTSETTTQSTTSETAETETTMETAVVGGFEKTDSPVVTDEIKALFEKATGGEDGVTYTPVAYLASQIVAGKNHLVLCRAASADKANEETYVLVALYEDLEGKAEITDVKKNKADAEVSGLTGGWTAAESPVVTDEAKTALEKAAAELTGAEYTPIALLSTQVVAGMNYRIFCEIMPVAPGAEPVYSIVQVYKDLQDGAQITDTYDFEE